MSSGDSRKITYQSARGEWRSRRQLALLLVAAVALLSACSRLEILYSQADWLILTYVDDYIVFVDDQRSSLKQDISRLLDWHCRTHVADYSDFLGVVGETFVQGTATPDRVGELADQIEAYWFEILREAMPSIARLMASLTQEQVSELFRRVSRDNAESEEQIRTRSNRDVAEDYRNKVAKQLEHWLGKLNPIQGRIVGDWSQEFRALGLLGLELRRERQRSLRELIERHRGSPLDLASALDANLASWRTAQPPAYRERIAHNKRVTHRMVSDVAMALDDTQIAHMEKRIASYRSDLIEIACE